MKKIEFSHLPAGSIVLVKEYNLWQRFKAWITRKKLKYNDAWIDPFGCSGFMFKNTFWNKVDVFTFVPKKAYSDKEKLAIFQKVLIPSITSNDPVESILKVNLVRPYTFSGTTLEELLDDNKYYSKTELK